MGLDQEIRKRFGVHEGDTLPNKARNCSREMLAKFMGEMGLKNGAEIGVLKGDYSQVLCHSIPDIKLKLIDPWIPFGRNYSTMRRIEGCMERTRNKTNGFDVELIRKGSLDAVKDIPNNSTKLQYPTYTYIIY